MGLVLFSDTDKRLVMSPASPQPIVTAPSSTSEQEQCLLVARRVLDIELQAVERLQRNLDERFFQAIQLIEAAEGRVVVTGMGKSGHIARKIAATLSSTGTPAYFMHPAEGTHGDLGVITKQDVVIAISSSGETGELLGVLPTLERFAIPVIAMTGKPQSTLARRSRVVLDISVEHEACAINLAPTASTTVTLALGDALAVALMERKGFSPDDFALFHPSGSLGKRLLLKVSDLMHTGKELPVCRPETPLIEALMEMSAKGFGLTLVLDKNNQLQGIVTDGDVRRALQKHSNLQELDLSAIVTKAPRTIAQDALAVKAIRLMQELKITALVVTEADSAQVAGLIHLHDLLKSGLN